MRIILRGPKPIHCVIVVITTILKPSYITTDATGLLSTNMFAYCENDPINKSDPSGEDWQETAKIGLMIAGVGLMALAVISTGGGALVFAGAGISVSAASATLTMATVTVSIGTAITGLSIIRAVNDNMIMGILEIGLAPIK